MRILHWLQVMTATAFVIANFIPHRFPQHERWLEVGMPLVWFELAPQNTLFWDDEPQYRGGIVWAGLVLNVFSYALIYYITKFLLTRVNKQLPQEES